MRYFTWKLEFVWNIVDVYVDADVSIFKINDDSNEENNKFFKYFWRILLKFEDKALHICKSNSLTGPFRAKVIATHIR